MTNARLLGVAKVRRSLIVPIVVFTLLNAASKLREFDPSRPWLIPSYVLFDIALWSGVAFLIFAVIERRQKLPPQPRLLAMAAATVSIAALATAIISVRALFGSILNPRPFLSVWVLYLPDPFYAAVFYVAIVTGIGYAVHSWAVDDRRLAEAAELDAAIARAELKAAAGRLRPESLDAALARLSSLMATDPAAAQDAIADLGALLHDSLRCHRERVNGAGRAGEELMTLVEDRQSCLSGLLAQEAPKDRQDCLSPTCHPERESRDLGARVARRPSAQIARLTLGMTEVTPDYPSVTTRRPSERFAGSVRFAPLANIERYDCAR